MTTRKADTMDMKAIPLLGHLLYLSPRPGHPRLSKQKLSACVRFVEAMKAKKVDFCVLLLTIPEVERYYDLGICLCDLYEKNGIKCLHYPIQDRSAPEDIRSFDGLMITIANSLKSGNVLIHCSGGVGRTGTVAAGLLVHQGEDTDLAIEKIRKVLSGAVENTMQEKFLHSYYDFLSQIA